MAQCENCFLYRYDHGNWNNQPEMWCEKDADAYTLASHKDKGIEFGDRLVCMWRKKDSELEG